MNNKKIALNIIQALKDLVIDMNEEDLNKFLSEDYLLSLRFTKIKNQKNDLDEDQNKSANDTASNSEQVFINLLAQLDSVITREEGVRILNDNLKNKSSLEGFAKYIDVGVQKIDKVEKIKENIIESTVGARLRSEAIQGKSSE